MRIIVYLTIWTLFITNLAFSQYSTDAHYKYTNAEEFLRNNEYPKAASIYEELLKESPGNNNLNYKLGYCYLYDVSKNQVLKAISNLEAASQSINSSNYSNTLDEIKAPKETYYSLAKAYRANKDYDKAISCFTKFKSLIKNDGIILENFIDKEIIYTKLLKKGIKIDAEFSLCRIEDILNYPYKIDNFPVISKDGNTLVFTSGENGNTIKDVRIDPLKMNYDKIYFSQKIDNKWTDPLDISFYYNVHTKTKPVCLSADGKDLYLVVDDNIEKLLFVRHYEEDKWCDEIKLNANINTGNVYHASISDDGNTLFFSSDRPGGLGGTDIYKSTKDKTGDWGQAINLGKTINTKLNEDFPFYMDDENKLFFCSQGHNSKGAFDLFSSHFINNDDAEDPVNIGFPVNSYNDDLILVSKINNNTVFFPIVMNVVTNDSNCYVIRDPSILQPGNDYVLRGNISFDDNYKRFNNIIITIIDSLTKDTIDIFTTNKYSDEYKHYLNSGNYIVNYQAYGYYEDIEHVIIPKKSVRKEIILDVKLKPISKIVADVRYKQEIQSTATAVATDNFEVKNIYFDFSSFKLRTDSKKELNRVIEFMKKRPEVKLIITGYTDSKGSLKINKYFSRQRAYSAYKYMLSKGITKRRLTYKGMPKSNYIAINHNKDGSDNPRGRQFNRRVEFYFNNLKKNFNITYSNDVPEEISFRNK